MATLLRDVVVLLPGITGSVLKKDGKVVWGYTAKTIGRALGSGGRSLERDLCLENDGPELDDLEDGITATGLMPDLHLLPGLWKIDGYGRLQSTLLDRFQLLHGENFFSFPYDWRRDNRVAARKLAKSSHEWLLRWRTKSGANDAKLILICHSMGGLVARHFLECLDGRNVTRALITFGTPFRGALNALEALSNGVKKGPVDLSKLMRQFTSVYQLLPTFPCVDVGENQLKRVIDMQELPNVDTEKAINAYQFHLEIEDARKANQSSVDYAGGYETIPVVGLEQKTSLSAQATNGHLRFIDTIEGKRLGGDGTVPRFSAIPIDQSDNTAASKYLYGKHGSLQNMESSLEQLVGFLSGTTLDLGSFRKVATNHVALDLTDIFLPNEVVSAVIETPRDAKLTVILSRAGDATPSIELGVSSVGGEEQLLEFGTLAPGGYRIDVRGDDVESLSDTFAVLEPPSVGA